MGHYKNKQIDEINKKREEEFKFNNDFINYLKSTHKHLFDLLNKEYNLLKPK